MLYTAGGSPCMVLGTSVILNFLALFYNATSLSYLTFLVDPIIVLP